ncbi:MAG: tetratricopeptide repeat protein [Hymenobacter sp.]|nr:MAG: tetratricopeptide repeat protein [Hymenobacter sp.]
MYFYAGQYPKALSTFEQYRGVAEKSTNTDAEYASFLYLTKKYPEALTEINGVLAKEPNNVTMNRLKAYSLFETGDYAGASTAMDNYLKVVAPEKIIPDDYVYQGKILSRAGKTAEAKVALDKALAVASPAQKADVQAEIAKVAMATGDYDSALKVMIEKAKGGDLADQYRLATAYKGAKKYTQADSVLNIINTAKPDYAPAYLERAGVNYYLDQDSKKGLSKPYYEKYVELSKVAGADPAKFKAGLTTSYNYLGVYTLQKGDKAGAKGYFQQVLALDPTNETAVNAMKAINGASAPARKPAVKTAAKK